MYEITLLSLSNKAVCAIDKLILTTIAARINKPFIV